MPRNLTERGETGMRPVCALLLGVVPAVPLPLLAQGATVEVTRIAFQGNVAFPADSLSRAIANKETGCRSTWLLPFCALRLGFSIDRRTLNDRELTRDVLRLRGFYAGRGYRQALVDTVLARPSDETVEITFRIDEGLPVRVSTLIVEGIEGLEAVDLMRDLPMEEGDLLSAMDLAATRDTLIQRLQNRGYPRADVGTVTRMPAETPFEANVTLEVDAGPHAVFGPIVLTGNVELGDAVIRRLLPFAEGQEYSAARMVEAQRNLYAIEMIQNVTIDEMVDPAGTVPDSIVPLQVRIAEGGVHRVRSGLGWSTSDCVNVEGRWASRNFWGGARRLQVRARLSNMFAEDLYTPICGQSGIGAFGGVNWLVATDFTQPLIFERFTFGASLFVERQSLQDVFVQKSVGLDVSLSRAVGPFTSLTFSYRPQLTALAAAEGFFCTSFLVCTPEDISTIQDPNWLAPVGVSFVRDQTNSLLNPTQGYQALLNFEHASPATGSDFPYSRAVGELTKYLPQGNGQVLAARVRGGWVNAGLFGLPLGSVPIVHPQKRFYSGGANSVRGFAQGQLGPRVLTVDVSRLLLPSTPEGAAPCQPLEIELLTCDAGPLRNEGGYGTPRPTGGSMVVEGGLEYRLPVKARMEAAFFADFGRIWAEAGSEHVSAFEITPGLGLRYLSPIGPIRLDVAYRFLGIEALPVVTSQIRPYDPTRGDVETDKIRRSVGGVVEEIDFVLKDELAVLDPLVAYGPGGGFSFGHLQLHISIGQAF